MASRIRRALQTAWLNPVSTGVYDHCFPAKTFGARGEREAERFLLRKGFIIVYRGYVNRFAEIDLVAVDGQTLVFVEVKTRSSDIAGRPDEAVDSNKQDRMTKAALTFLRQNNLLESRARFDVISISWGDASDKPVIEHFENAFEPAGSFQMFS